MITLIPSPGSYIIELKEKISSIEAEIRKNAGKAGQNRKLKTKLADLYDKLGRAYQQKGDADSAKWCFARAKDQRK